MQTIDMINARLESLMRSNFRSKFRLHEVERAIVHEKGIEIIKVHAKDLLTKRLAPAEPKNDGKQTPFRGHPVFIAQHATATCCRKCLQTWHKIPKGKEMDAKEIIG